MKKSLRKTTQTKDQSVERPAGGAGPPDGAPAAGADPDRYALCTQLVTQANSGDPGAIRRLGAFLDQNPWLWQRAGDLVAATESAWINLLVGQDCLTSESVKRHVAALKATLGGEQPTKLESLLVEQIAVTWLASKHAEVKAACPATAALAQDAFQLKRAESAQKRYFSAMKTLALLRTLLPQGLAPLDAVRAFDPKRKQA